MWNVMFTDDDLHINTESIRWPQHLHHPPPSRPPRRRVAGDLDIDRQSFEREARIFGISGLQGEASLVAKHPVWRFSRIRDDFIPLGNSNGAANALVQRGDAIPSKHNRISTLVRASVVEYADNRRVTPGENPRNAPGTTSVPTRKCFIYKD